MKWFLSCDLITCDTFNHSKSSLSLSLSVTLSCLQLHIFFFFFFFFFSLSKKSKFGSFHIFLVTAISYFGKDFLVTSLSNEQAEGKLEGLRKRGEKVWKGGQFSSLASSLRFHLKPFLSLSLSFSLSFLQVVFAAMIVRYVHGIFQVIPVRK